MQSHKNFTLLTRRFLLTLRVCGIAGTTLLAAVPSYAQKKAAVPAAKTAAGPLNLLPCIGKGFPEYAKVLGPPASVKKPFDVEYRVYMSPKLAENGIAKIKLSYYDLIKGSDNAIPYIEVVFKPGTSITWQKALDLLGLPKEGITTAEHEFSMSLRKEGGGGFESVPAKELLLEGMTIKGVPMAAVDQWPPRDQFDVGFGVTWCDNSPDTKSPVLTISYKATHLYYPVVLTPWEYHAIEGAEGKMETLPDGAVKITTTKVGAHPWSSAAWVSSTEVKNFVSNGYRITFEAKADYDRTIWVFAEFNENPFTPIGLDEKNIRLTTGYQKFSFLFVPKNAENHSVRIPNFFVGDKVGSVTIRNIGVGLVILGP